VTWQQRIHHDDLTRCVQALGEATRTRTTVEIEARLYDRDEPRWHRVVFALSGGRWFASAVDIHAARTTNAERAELLVTALAARADAELANRHKDQFLAAVSHELRTPLTTMLLWERVLRDAGSDPAAREQALDAIHDSAVAQSRLVGDLLDISRAISGKLRVDLRSIDVTRLVAEALAAVATIAAARGISIISPDVMRAVLVCGDGFRVRQILDNLLSNALKFTQRGGAVGVSIVVRSRQVRISITDTGRGIAAAFLERIFDPFSQSDDALTRASSGTGLGLAISKQLVELQHGTLTVSSRGHNLGSTFSVTLPAAGRASSPTVASHVQSLGKVRILVVDDDCRVLDALKLLLGRAGAVVVTAQSTDDAKLRLAEQLPDVLLCDIAMPGEDGYSLIASLRASGVAVPAIALTAHAMEADAARAIAAGFDVHLAKPVDFDRLVGCISSLRARRTTLADEHDA
jgi:signal transduction histidine kinase/CheY-like chemotaxis protein